MGWAGNTEPGRYAACELRLARAKVTPQEQKVARTEHTSEALAHLCGCVWSRALDDHVRGWLASRYNARFHV